MSCQIHPTAIVDPKAELGEEVEVGAYSLIGPDVKLGDRCRIAPHVVLEGLTTIGAETQIFQFASVGSAPQDLKYHGEPSTLTIGSRNIIREYVTIQPGTEGGRMATVVGDGNLFMANCHVGHDCIVGSHNVFANSVGLAGHVTVGDRLILGGLVGIHQFVRLGDYALLSAGSMVGTDIPPFCIGQGDRCHLRGINVIGLRRAGFTATDVQEIKRVYRLLFSSVGGLDTKIAELPPELLDRPLVEKMLAFIKETERGICHPAKEIAQGEA